MDFDRPAMLPIPRGRYPQVWGANMVFRRSALQALGGFDTRLGPVGGKRYCAEDTDIVQRMLQSGRPVAYDPALTVFHRVPRARLRRAYFRRVMWDMGEGEVSRWQFCPAGRASWSPALRFRLMARLAVRRRSPPWPGGLGR
jgi:cellulose synthase/poly-beta-1,6-N-acetylglucosamine synthase-like glycosyltransferase